jgi:hypothetical protein
MPRRSTVYSAPRLAWIFARWAGPSGPESSRLAVSGHGGNAPVDEAPLTVHRRVRAL